MKTKPEYVSVSEAARILSVSIGTVYRSVESGRLPSLRLHRHGAIRIPLSALRVDEEPAPEEAT